MLTVARRIIAFCPISRTLASRIPILIALLSLDFLGGCGHSHHVNLIAIQAGFTGPGTQDLTLPFYDPDVSAVVDPPIGWKPDPLKNSSQHIHQVWLSPTGATAYGVIHFSMPLPVGQNLALSGFLTEMKHSEGEANLISRTDDPNLPGIRFVAEGGRYRLRANLIVDGWEGWAVYAGTLRNKAIIPEELDMAERCASIRKLGNRAIRANSRSVCLR